jgi:hypothetical protein
MDISKRLPQTREKCFPDLFLSGYGVTSPEDPQYNCIAWAAGDENTDAFWTPYMIGGGYYWPEDKVPRNAKVATFIKLYETVAGYVVCNTGDLEEGVEKIALYADPAGEITHAARQQANGIWTSKLGDWEDIDHISLDGLAGAPPAYGSVVQFLKRPRAIMKSRSVKQ